MPPVLIFWRQKEDVEVSGKQRFSKDKKRENLPLEKSAICSYNKYLHWIVEHEGAMSRSPCHDLGADGVPVRREGYT